MEQGESVKPAVCRSIPWKPIIFLAVAAAIGFKLLLATTTYGTNDVRSFENFCKWSKELGAVELYRKVELFNHPPFMVRGLQALGWLASVSGIGFPFWIRLPAIVADAFSVLLVYQILKRTLPQEYSWAAIATMALSPISILVSGFHGNTDPVMICLVLLSIYLLDVRSSVWLAGAAFGMSMNIKVVPLVLVPAVFFYLPGWKQRLQFFAMAGCVFIVASLPYIFQDPLIICRRVFGYGSLYGNWGISRLISALPENWPFLYNAFERYGKYVVMGGITGISYWINRQPDKPPLFRQFGLILFMFLAISPGFGVQYLAWLVPWVTQLGVWACLAYYATGGTFLYMVYDYWCLGGRWNLADSELIGGWKGDIIDFEMLCWLAVVGIAILLLMRAKPTKNAPVHAKPARAAGGSLERAS